MTFDGLFVAADGTLYGASGFSGDRVHNDRQGVVHAKLATGLAKRLRSWHPGEMRTHPTVVSYGLRTSGPTHAT